MHFLTGVWSWHIGKLMAENNPSPLHPDACPEQNKTSQLNKEVLALVYGVEQLHQYLWGTASEAYTDHKPLLGLLRLTNQFHPRRRLTLSGGHSSFQRASTS